MDNGNSFCVYNLDRGISLNSKVSLAACANQPLKILRLIVSGIALDAESGLWLKPLYGAPAVPRIFPFDLLYLDKDQRVLQAIEIFPEVELPPCPEGAESALLLPQKILHATGTACGDRLLVCAPEELHRELSRIESAQTETTGLVGVRLAGRKPEPSKPLAIPPKSPSSPVEDPGGSLKKNGSKIPATEKPSKGDEERDSRPRPGDSDETAKTPAIAITEVIIETPLSASSLKTPVHHDPGDLFGNWVDSRATPPAWIEHQSSAEARAAEPNPITSAVVKSGQDGATSIAGVTGGVAKTADPGDAMLPHARLQSESVPKPAVQKQSDAKPEPTRNLRAGEPSTAAPAQSQQTKNAPLGMPQPSSTFTVAQFGMWRISPPTAVGAVSAGMVPADGKHGNGASPKIPPPVHSPSSRTAGGTEMKPETVLQSDAPPESTGVRVPSRSNPDAERTPARNPAPVDEKVVSQSRATNQDAIQLKSEKPLPSTNGKDKPASSLDARDNGRKPTEANAPGPAQLAPKQSESKGAGKNSVERDSSTTPLASPGPARNDKVKVGHNGDDSHSLKARFKRWLNPVTPVSDRRRAQRRYVPGVVAHYYTGGAPKPHEVADVSMTGFYLLTEDRWMPGTMIQMTLQKPCAKGERKQSITVLSRIVRRGSDGVGAEFVMPEAIDSRSHDVQPTQPTDRFALARFL